MAVFSMKIPALEAVDTGKILFFVQYGRVPGMSERVQLVRLVPGCWRMLPGVIVLVWYKITQRVIKYRFCWYFLTLVRVILYRCGCVPMTGADLGAGGGGAGGGGEVVPVVPGGGGTPLSTPRVGTIRGFGMQKFFFRVWGHFVLWVEWG